MLIFGLFVVQNPCKKEFIDKWSTSFAIGDDVVVGLYHQRWGSSDRSFFVA